MGRTFGALVLGLVFSGTAAEAGPLEEVRALSYLPALDLARLKSGEIVTQRGKDGGFARGISLESCYFVAAPMAEVGNKLLHWDPTRHPEMETRLYRDYPPASPAPAFQAVRLSSRVANDRWLLDHTYAIADGGAAGDLHLTEAEVQVIRQGVPNKAASAPAREARANDVWGQILRRRSESLASGGMTAVAPYGSEPAISPSSEFRGLLTLNEKAGKHFRPILGARPFVGSGTKADEAIGYWETSLVRGHTTLQLGVFAAHKGTDSWQLVDCVYYPTDTYFMALNVFQLWPVEGGTLVYQVGFVSAPFRTYLGGVDRYVAGKQMVGETLRTIKAFRADLEKRR